MRSFTNLPSSVCGGFHGRRFWAAAWLALAAAVSTTVGHAAEREVVGVLALALEPEVAQQIGLTPTQLAHISQIVVDREAEVLDLASDFRGLTPDERFAKLAPFRKESEEKGLAILSSQQRAKLEQLRFKRYGLSVLADPVIAERLRIPPEQQAAVREAVRVREEKLRELGPNAPPDELQKLDEPIAALLGEPQRAALRAVLMGEAPIQGTSAPADVAGEPPAAGTTAQPPSDAATAPAEMPSAPAMPEADPVPSDSETASPHATRPDDHSDAPGVTNSESGGTLPVTPPASEPSMMAAPDEGAASPPPSAAGAGAESATSTPTEQASPPSDAAEAPQPQNLQPQQNAPSQPSSPISDAPQPSPTDAADSQAGVAQSAPGGTGDEGQYPATSPAEAPPQPSPAPQAPAATQAVPPAASIAPGPATLPGAPATAPTSDGTAPPTETALPPSDVRLRFNFRYQPWQEVLTWFAEQAGLSLVMENPPSGTFNYVDDREFTPSEAIDLLNSVLLMKGHMLVRKERMLILLNLDDGIPPNLVDTVLPEELDQRGDHELVSTLFQLQRMSPEEAETEVKKLLGPQGSVLVLPKSKQLFVTETAGKLRTIRRVIDAIENPEAASDNVRVIQVNPSTVDQVLNIVRQMFQIPVDQNATEDGSLRFALDPGGARLLVTGTPDMLDRFAKVVEAADPTASGDYHSGIDSTPQL
ncbi:MAG: hypothetical protein GYA33_16755, partial [Thermogutta sp.]|nr:hypothetical protein [Thermogutta sp.]